MKFTPEKTGNKEQELKDQRNEVRAEKILIDIKNRNPDRGKIELEPILKNSNPLSDYYIELYNSCYQIWSAVIDGEFFDAIASGDFELEMTSSKKCLEGYPGKIQPLDPVCISDFHTNQAFCERSVLHYKSGVIAFYLDHISKPTNPAEIPVELLVYKYIYDRYLFGANIKGFPEYPEHLKRLDSYLKYLTEFEDPVKSNEKIVLSSTKEDQLRILSTIGFYYTLERDRWFGEVELYKNSDMPEPTFLFFALVYGHERYREFEEMRLVIDEYIDSGNEGGWGYYMLARYFAREDNPSATINYLMKASAIDSDNVTFEYTKNTIRQMIKENEFPLIKAFGDYKDKHGYTVFGVFNPVAPWETFSEMLGENRDN